MAFAYIVEGLRREKMTPLERAQEDCDRAEYRVKSLEKAIERIKSEQDKIPALEERLRAATDSYLTLKEVVKILEQD